MKLSYLVLVLIQLIVFNVWGQKMDVGFGQEGKVFSSLNVATSCEEAYKAFDELIPLLRAEKDLTLTVSSSFSNADTLLEILRVDTCAKCWSYNKYEINISAGLDIDTYRNLLQYAEEISEIDHYIDKNFYGNFLFGISAIIHNDKLLRGKNLTASQKNEYRSFMEGLLILKVKSGSTFFFRNKYSQKHFITDKVCAEVIKQLEDPKYPPFLIEQYMADHYHLWDPALIDTTGIPQRYFDNPRVNCSPDDTLCEKYDKISFKFSVYSDRGKALGITAEEALYKRVSDRYRSKGFKDFSAVIEYAIEFNDQRLLPALQEFVHTYPDYKMTEEQIVFFQKE